MNKALNIGAFLGALICIGLSYSAISYLDLSATYALHPLMAIVYVTLCVFLLGVLGFKGIRGWVSAFRSLATIGMTVGLVIFILVLHSVGSLIK
ncbi:hypothetical protein CGZ90_12905 [Fictibacillus aquaticus]|uniref:Uncharacterized protein n=1 Tax=Fictibacillus aquaticus TaxID=2021314 RepID=A0A235F8I9_9BACL|nr:hypothetical protein CGZ90_12905 [Fictibacillus aquaticus]